MTDPTGPDQPGLPEKPFERGSTGPEVPAGPTPGSALPAKESSQAGTPGPYAASRPKRTSAQIRADIDAQRNELGQSVDQLRDRVTELTDWRGQIRKHRKQIIVGAVATGFIVGGLAALRRR